MQKEKTKLKCNIENVVRLISIIETLDDTDTNDAEQLTNANNIMPMYHILSTKILPFALPLIIEVAGYFSSTDKEAKEKSEAKIIELLNSL
jgi:hypothetical protein